MARFYNPYHFIPVSKPQDGQAIPRSSEKVDLPPAVTHERFVPGTHSGRLVVRLTTVTPTVLGSTQDRPHDKEVAIVKPYLVNGVPGIPGSSLRGLIGSVIEAATNAPLRVLHHREYSYRRSMETSLSAIGLLVEDKGELKLRPMCLPTLESKDGGRTFEAPARFRRIFPTPQFKVFFGDRESIRDPGFGYRTHLASTPPVEMPVKQLAWNGSKVLDDGRTLHTKADRYLIAQKADRRDPGRPGRVRVLGCWRDERVKEIPSTKKHELWIPEPAPDGPTLEIAERALARFRTLANERTKDDGDLPFEPLDTRPGRAAGECLVPMPGDMVYFDVNSAGTEVTEISYSAIWRGRVEDPATKEPATSWKFFGGIDPELLPANPSRKTISAAEALLGFADDVKDESSSGLALASRVRFADALPVSGTREDLFLPPVVLKILGSPKPPCPALYFKPRGQRGGGYIEKKALNPEEHEPQGRKWYLHAKPTADPAPWASAKPRDPQTKGQKNRVTPIKADTAFYFHIDFDNLTDAELGLLLFALEPDRSFCHKIGMGKPLGLGSVKIEVAGYFPVDRQRRYSVAGLRANRYAPSVITEIGQALKGDGKVPARYAREFGAEEDKAESFRTLRTALDETGLLDAEATRALLLVGNFGAAPAASDVRYPTTVEQVDRETEQFKWFVFNGGQRERGRGMSPNRQSLKPLNGERRLPWLQEL